MDKIAIFGGTFNPIHKGHINLCLECAKNFCFKKILLIPTNLSPHKRGLSMVSNEHRLQMCRLAAKCDPLFEVSDLEIRMQGVSYTVNTLRELQKQNPDAELYLIIGSDMLFMFHQWYCHEEILQMVHLVVGAREPSEYQKMAEYVHRQLKNGGQVHVIHIHILPVSSTEIRVKVKEKRDVSAYLDTEVLEYIKNNQLYDLAP